MELQVNPQLNNVRDEHNEAYDFLNAKKLRQANQLVLLNNLQRGDQNIASTTLFSIVHRVFSALYSDVLTVKFVPSEDSDHKKTEALNKLQVNDYREMEKYKLDYDWIWNTVFYGDGYCETLKWDSSRKIMVPEVVNNLMFFYDPYFAEVQDWRYYGKWLTKSKFELKRLLEKGLLEKDITEDVLSTLPSSLDADIWNYKSLHDQARAATTVPDNSFSRTNNIFQILEWFTHDADGNKVVLWVDKNFSRILRKKVINLGEDKRWPIVRKQIFREPNSSVSISIPDLIEDKHRAKNVLYNLIYMAAKDEANPIYAYNPDIVKDVTVFFQRQLEQHIPMEDIEKGVKRLNMGPSLSNAILQFISLLNTESSDAVGTTVVQPIAQKGKKSATEAALAQQIADLTQALQSKILGIGEKEFWSHWYQRQIYFIKDSDEKAITLTNVDTFSFEHIKLDDIKTKFPPKIEIMSQRDADYKELVNKRDMMQMYPIITKDMLPQARSNFDKYIFLPKFIKDSSTIDRIVPKTLEEIKAEQENDMLEQNKLPKIQESDDDETHLYVHYRASKYPATWAHIFSHETQRAQKKKQTEQQSKGPPDKQIRNNTEQGNLAEATAPLGQETADKLAVQGGKKVGVPS